MEDFYSLDPIQKRQKLEQMYKQKYKTSKDIQDHMDRWIDKQHDKKMKQLSMDQSQSQNT